MGPITGKETIEQWVSVLRSTSISEFVVVYGQGELWKKPVVPVSTMYSSEASVVTRTISKRDNSSNRIIDLINFITELMGEIIISPLAHYIKLFY